MTKKKPIRLILVDDHRVVHQALAEMVSFVDDFELVAQGSNGDVTHTTGTENRGRWRQAGGACLRLATCAQVR